MQNSPIKYKAFTTTSHRIADSLKNTITIAYNGKQIRARALWDTGATCTCISYRVVKELSLIPTGARSIRTPSGSKEVNDYCIDVILPNNLTINGVTVCDSDIGEQGIDALLGMNIITLGDFAISNYNGQTIFTFRTPSKRITDYVKLIQAENIVGVPHGKGKRKLK